MQEFSQRVCQYVEAFENEQKKKYKMSLQKTEASAGTAHIFLKRVNFNLCFTCLKWQLLFHCFHFFVIFFVCTIPRFAHSLFNAGLLLSSLGSSAGAPPPLQSCIWLFIRTSNRVESSRAATTTTRSALRDRVKLPGAGAVRQHHRLGLCFRKLGCGNSQFGIPPNVP